MRSEAARHCDGSNLGGASCTSLGFTTGTLACEPWCEFDASGCSGTPCSGGTVQCGGICTNLSFDPANCNACGQVCSSVPNGVTACAGGTCGFLCNSGYANCNQSAGDGCEVDLASNLNHCGTCGTVCPVPPGGSPACTGGVCGVGSCNPGLGDCDLNGANGCEADLSYDENNCGACATACVGGDFCNGGGVRSRLPPNPTNFDILALEDVTYAGIDYLLLKVSLASTISVASDWCYEYTNLCQAFGFLPTGCGASFSSAGYGTCKTTYLSDGVSDSLGCNASGGVQAAANAAGFFDATGSNAFAFHYCDVSTCTDTMCSGPFCNTALSYFDATQPHGYTLCKKP